MSVLSQNLWCNGSQCFDLVKELFPKWGVTSSWLLTYVIEHDMMWHDNAFLNSVLVKGKMQHFACLACGVT